MRPCGMWSGRRLHLDVGAASAADIGVRMLNKGEKGAMVFEPDLAEAKPGDVVPVIAPDKGHDVESGKGMLPEGVEPFKGGMNENYDLAVTTVGVYGVKCSPHFPMAWSPWSSSATRPRTSGWRSR